MFELKLLKTSDNTHCLRLNLGDKEYVGDAAVTNKLKSLLAYGKYQGQTALIEARITYENSKDKTKDVYP